MGHTYGKKHLALSEAAQIWLQQAEWPGNVRQLRQHLERAVLLTDESVLEPVHFRHVRRMDAQPAEGGGEAETALPEVGSMTLDEIERAMILKSLQYHAGNLSRVAESLGMSRAALYRRLDKYGIRT
jgi:DNA-binding NtrC family response regulator